VQNSALTAEEHRYGTFQIFASNPRAWEHRTIAEDDAGQFRSIVKRSGSIPFAHVPYLCNPSSSSGEILRKSLDMLIGNMQSCAQLGINGIVVHMGSHLGKGEEHGRRMLIRTVSSAIDKVPGVKVLMENSSGYRNSVGSRFEEIGKVTDEFDIGSVGVCLDTCHAFAAGYDLRTKESIEKVCDEFDDLIGFKRLSLVHLNDARYGLGSGLDRHWHIGQGNIGKAGFTEFFRNRHFNSGSFIMETPINEQGNEATNMRAARRIVESLDFELF
jgi:deoxyribonuclease-4